MPDIVLTADKTVLINYRLTCLGGFTACIPRGSLKDILEDAKVNAESRYVNSITLLAEDELRYGNRLGEWVPCGKIVDLVSKVKKLGKPISPSHANLSSAAAAPEVVREYSKVLGLTKDNFSAFQVGLETGSTRLMNLYMRGKALPWRADEWPEVAKKVSYPQWSFYLLKENGTFLASRILPPQRMRVG